MYINDLPDELITTPKLFADDTAIFSVVHCSNQTVNDLNHDLDKISDWAYKWKMEFNSDPSKPVQEMIFSCKVKKENHL